MAESRVEAYLANLTGDGEEKPVAMSRVEEYLQTLVERGVGSADDSNADIVIADNKIQFIRR